jgi:hypothetical protein
MSKKLVITLEDDGTVYRGKKLIATVEDGEIKFKHYSYKKHAQEIEMLIVDGGEPAAEIIEDEPLFDTTVDPVTPKELFVEGEGKWYGEENPPVVEWRKKHWSAEAFDDKYGHKEILLKEIYNKHNLIYDRNNTD